MRSFVVLLICCFHGVFLQAQDTDSIRIAFLTDIHVSPGAETEQNLVNIVEEINTGNFDFVTVTGDLTNTGTDAELVAVHRALSALKFPLYVIPGNHETNWSESACQTFDSLWHDDKFFFTKGKYNFVGYSTGPYLKMGDGHVRAEDLGWIDQTLRKNYRPGTVTISLSHYPLGEGLDNWFAVTGILKKYNTRLALCGHGHRLSLHNFDGIPGVMGRAALTKGSATPGYNVVTLKNDSVFIDQKIWNDRLAKTFLSFALNNPSVLSGKASEPRPDYSINQQYSSPVAMAYADTASIYTGVLTMPGVFVYGTSAGELIAVNSKNKKPVWRRSFGGALYATPVKEKNVLVVGTIDGHIYGLNAENGKEKWRLATGEPVISEGIAEDGAVYIGSGSHHFYKIDAASGKLIWTNNDMDGQMQGKPTLSRDEVIFGAWDRHLYCLDKSTGKLKWKWDNGSKQKLYSPGNVVPAVANGKVLIVAPDRYMTAIDLHTGQTVWRNNAYRVRESMTISADGREVYAKLMNDSIIAVSTLPDTFQLSWCVNAGFGYEHNPCPLLEYNGVVYAGTKNGVVVAVDAASHRLLWKYKAGNSSVNKITAGPAGQIWVSLIEGKIISFKPGLSKI